MTPFHLMLIPLVAGVALASGGGTSKSRPTVADDPHLDDEIRSVPIAGGAYTSVGPDGLASMLENKDFWFVNVHVPYAGEIEQTDAFVPFDQIEQNLDSFPSDKDAMIVLYCRSEGMGVTSAAELIRLGYTNVWNLEGGMNAWTASGRELLRNDRNDV